MVEIFNKECYTCFLKSTINYLINDEDIDDIKEQFLKYINNDLEKYHEFIAELPMIKEELKQDLEFFLESDPAIDSKDEVIWAYPGYKAIACYRIAHALYMQGLKVQSRVISEYAHSLTGIDIHPAAKIASPFFIDHGTGIVIGETTIIDKYVKLYQGVTLGALSLANARAVKGIKRHPMIGKNVTIYASATILGNIRIGDNVTVGANVFLTDNVDDNVMVTISKPELVIKEKK